MVADRIGYGRCFAFAFLCHILSTFILLFARGYWWLYAGWALVYTSFIMMILRFSAKPVVRALTPLGVLIASSALAVIGLIMLSKAQGTMILAAATVYGLGKTYLWPTMLAAYLGLWFVFRRQGGYRPVELKSPANQEETS